MLTSSEKRVKRLTPAASQALLSHSWPGNVRELHNVIQNAIVTVREAAIDAADPHLASSSVAASSQSLEKSVSTPWTEAVAQLEKIMLERALRAASGNRAEAARVLGIRRQLLYSKLKEHQMETFL